MATNAARPLPPRGLPILSGPPPITESSTCRQCGREFNLLWRRKHSCGHCGYEYCSSCLSDGQALMPRRSGSGSGSSSTGSSTLAEIKDALGIEDRKPTVGGGYEVESVCLYCLSMLQVTAAPLPILRSLPLKRLKEYLAAYDIPCIGPKEKEDFVQAVIKAKNPTTGCLSPEHESYFRRRSVPKQGQFPTRTTNGSSTSTPRARPPPAQARPSPQSSARPPPNTNINQTFTFAPRPSTAQAQARPPPPRPQTQTQTRPQARPPTSAPTTPARQPSPPVPTILSLVSLPNSYLSSLSIGTLKAILYENHVRVDFKQVLEKNELIARVSELVADERKRLERQRLEEERLANPVAPSPPAVVAAAAAPTPDGTSGTSDDAGADGPGADPTSGAPKVSVPTGPMPEIDRGLCVVCQDEEATLAVVDCGHLCMCAHCSDLIMATSQECPLCRTRIVTKHRLIRIYRT